ncbi:MAG: tRNA pseudouridine(55) synthase TruB [Candidatus Hydrothermales bacterium]
MAEKINGFLNIKKPKGWTTYDCVRHVKKAINQEKVGHAGNLDPHATGVVVIGIGKATKLLPYVMELEKVYIADVRLGILTDTWDITGEIIQRKEVPEFTKEKLEKVIKEFEGEIEQIPPPYSAVRKGGKRLYELARQGIIVTPKSKKVFIKQISLLDVRKNGFTIRVTCSKGTYIRALAKDIAEKLGTVGVIENLLRERVGHFYIKESIDPNEDLLSHIKPLEYGVLHFGEVTLKKSAVEDFEKGVPIPFTSFLRFSANLKRFSFVRVYDEAKNFIGIGQIDVEYLNPRKVFSKFEELPQIEDL